MKTFNVSIKTTFWKETTIQADTLKQARQLAQEIDGIDTFDFETEIKVAEQK